MKRPLFFVNAVVLVPLTQGYVAQIDFADIDVLADCDWSVLISPRRTAVYACRVQQGKMRLLHREVARAERGDEIDHRDGDGLNCRRYNLRNCTRQQNCQNGPLRRDNKAGLKGAIRDTRSGKWRAEITVNGRRIYLGLFGSAVDAHAAYRKAALSAFGEFARLS